MGSLENKSAVVTGAGKGIGRAIAMMLGGEGAIVVASARTESDLLSLSDELAAAGGECVPVVADVREDSGIQRLYEAATDSVGAADILISNAGVGLYADLADTTMAQFDNIMATNIRGTYAFVKRFLPDLLARGSGDVVMVASVAGLHGFPGESAYCASKFAQVGFAQALDNEVRGQGIRVSCICSGGVNTHFALGDGRTPGDPMLKRFMAPEDIAQAVRLAVMTGPNARILNVTMRSMIEPVALGGSDMAWAEETEDADANKGRET